MRDAREAAVGFMPARTHQLSKSSRSMKASALRRSCGDAQSRSAIGCCITAAAKRRTTAVIHAARTHSPCLHVRFVQRKNRTDATSALIGGFGSDSSAIGGCWLIVSEMLSGRILNSLRRVPPPSRGTPSKACCVPPQPTLSARGRHYLATSHLPNVHEAPERHRYSAPAPP
jgi:hypothetical protein